MKKFIIYILISFPGFFLSAQEEGPEKEFLRQGNAMYRNSQFGEAEASYRKALTAKPADKMVQFNLATALYRQDKVKEAAELFNGLELAAETEAAIKEKSFYNSGVMLAKQNKLEESAEAFKQSLRLDPTDNDARENLQKVLMELKKRQSKKDKESPKKNKKEKEKPRPKLSPRQVEQQLKLLELKEQNVKERLQKKSNLRGGAQEKDW